MSALNRPMATLAIHNLAFGHASMDETLDRLDGCIDPDPRIDAIEKALDRSIRGAGLSEYQIRSLLAGGNP